MKLKLRLTLLSVPALLLVTSVTTVRSQTGNPEDPDFLQPQGQGLWRDLDGSYWCGGNCGPNQRCCSITIVDPQPY